MKVIYSDMAIPTKVPFKSIFLAGPTPRDKETRSWRPDALHILKREKYKGMVFVPERKDWQDCYDNQVEWENKALNSVGIIIFWIPRDLKTMPGFTTNVEFGRFAKQFNVLYGRPDNAPENRYLDWYYAKYNPRMYERGKIYNNLTELLTNAML